MNRTNYRLSDMNRIKLAVLTGGNSVESPSAYDSARDVLKHLDPARYQTYVVDIVGTSWWVKTGLGEEAIAQIDRNDFSFVYQGTTTRFDCVFMVMHGGEGENGMLQGYFEMLNIPYTGSGVLASALCANKHQCKQFLSSATNVALPNGILVNEHNYEKQLWRAPLPCIVKPNGSGSSFGVSMVRDRSNLESSVALAMKYDEEVMIEEAIDGIEVTIGVMIDRKGHEYVFAPTETHFQGDVFDTDSKLIQENTRLITPARLPSKVLEHCQHTALSVYKAIGCQGLTRIDFIIKGDVPYFLEVNTIPGMMLKSSIPRQIEHSGIGLQHFYNLVIEDAMSGIPQKVGV